MTAHSQPVPTFVALVTFWVCGLMGLSPASSLAVQPSSKSSHRGPPLPAKADAVETQIQKQIIADRARHKQLLEKADREIRAAENRIRSGMSPELSKLSGLQDNGSFRGPAVPALPPFVPAAAPPAEECFKAYVAAAKNATSMEQLLDYLPYDEQKTLRERQARYDPKEAAESRERWRKRDPKITEKDIAFLTSSPYAHALDHHKSIANKFLYVLSSKSDGNKATIVVSTVSVAKSGGQEYPYGKATIELIGQAGYWRIYTYNDSGWHYTEPPAH